MPVEQLAQKWIKIADQENIQIKTKRNSNCNKIELRATGLKCYCLYLNLFAICFSLGINTWNLVWFSNVKMRSTWNPFTINDFIHYNFTSSPISETFLEQKLHFAFAAICVYFVFLLTSVDFRLKFFSSSPFGSLIWTNHLV